MKQLGNPYWWGTFGQVATRSLLEQKRKQYPNQYTAKDFEGQLGKIVHDCVGLIKGYRWTNDGKLTYKANQDVDVSGMLKSCSKQGTINTMPDVPGTLVFMSGHVGVYIGNGEVIEAMGHAYGVVLTKLKNRPWTKWGQPDWIEYEVKEMTKEEQIKLIKEKAGLEDNTIQFLDSYRWGDQLIEKLANAMK